MEKVDLSLALKRFYENRCPACGSQRVHQYFSCKKCGSKWSFHETVLSLDIQDNIGEKFPLNGDLKGIENLPQILFTLLDNKKILPAFIGIDEHFDELIQERLNK